MLRFLISFLFLSSPLLAQEFPPGAFARLGGTALRHPEKPIALAFRSGTTELASLGSDGTVRVWDTGTGKELHCLRKKDQHANGMAFSDDGRLLAVHFGEKHFHIYKPAKKYEQASFATVKTLEGMTISNDGKFVAGMNQGKPMIVEVATGLDHMELPDGTAVAVAPDGKSVAVGRKEENMHFVDVLEVPSGKRMLRMNRPGTDKSNISTVAYAPNSRTIAFSSDYEGGTIVVGELGKQEPIAKIDGFGPVAFVNAELLIGRQVGKLVLWNTNGKTVHEIARQASVYAAPADGKILALDSGGLIGSPRIRIWDAENDREIFRDSSELNDVLGISPGAREGVRVKTFQEFKHWMPKPLDPDPQIIPIEVGPRRMLPNRDGYSLRASSGNGDLETIAIHGEKSTFEIVARGKNPTELSLDSPALGIAVHPEGKSFAVIGRDGFVRVWDRAGKELWTARTSRSLRAGIAYSPDGKTLAVTSIIRVALFDSAEGKLLDTIARQWEEGPFTSVCFNHDGSLLAAGTMGSAGSGIVYEFASRKPVKRCEGNCGSVIGVAFSAKTDDLVTAHADDSLLAWHTHTPKKAVPDIAKLWDALASKEAEVAWPAMMELVEAREKAVALITEGLKADAKKPEELLRKQRAELVLNRIASEKAK